MTRTTNALAGPVLGLVLLVSGCTSPEPAGQPSGTSSGRSASPSSGAEAGRGGASPGSTGEADPARRDPLAAGARTPAGPAEAARILTAATRVVEDPASSADELATAGHAEQLAVREVSLRPAWDDRVLRRLSPALRADLRDHLAARRALRSMHPASSADLATELPAWRVVAPPPAPRLRRWYGEAERTHGVDWEVLAAVHLVETVLGRVRGTSTAGAQGPMQFLPSTWDIYGEGGDIHDPHDAIQAAARLLEANGFATDPAGALRHYNDSAAYVEGVLRHAAVLRRRPSALLGYHGWQVHYLTARGSVWLREGYAARRPVPVGDYLREHPDGLR